MRNIMKAIVYVKHSYDSKGMIIVGSSQLKSYINKKVKVIINKHYERK